MSTESLRADVLKVDQQHAIIRNTTSFPVYDQLMQRHFAGVSWNRLVEQATSPETSPDFFRFLGLVGMLCAQYGFPSMGGLESRHKGNRWEKPATTPRHQLGLASYISFINTQSYPIKEKMTKRLENAKGDLKDAGWGIMLQVSKGMVYPRENNISGLKSVAEDRLHSYRPICLPMPVLNQQLADLSFTGDDAERMSDHRFEVTIFPQVQKIVKDYFDPVPVFVDNQPRRFPFRAFSI